MPRGGATKLPLQILLYVGTNNLRRPSDLSRKGRRSCIKPWPTVRLQILQSAIPPYVGPSCPHRVMGPYSLALTLAKHRQDPRPCQGQQSFRF